MIYHDLQKTQPKNVIQYNNLFQAYLLQESIYDILKD